MWAAHLGGEMGSSQTVLPFKLAANDESLTAHGGLALFGEYLRAMSICGLINLELSGPGSAAGYDPSAHILPLILMLAGGGRTLEDLRVLRHDEGLRLLLRLNEMPSSDATGDWLRRMGAKESGGLAGLQRVNRCVFRRLLRNDERTDYTLDIDATQIVAEKREARYTYKGEKGYMPMVGHIAETGLVIGHEFREGNAAPAAGNLEFLQVCEGAMPKGKRIGAVRADSAAYQAAIFDWCEKTGKVFAIGADQDVAVKTAIAAIPESNWTRFRDGEIAETVHCMNKTKKAFRLVVMRRAREQDVFGDHAPYRYHAIASNRSDEDAQATMEWYSRRGGIHALRFVPSQRRILFHRRADLQSVSRLSLACARKRVGAFAGADRALAAVSDGGQDRPPWSTGVFENQRGDAGRICSDPRVLRARHAGRRRHSRNVLTPGAAVSRFWEAAHTAPPIAEPRPRRSKAPTFPV